MTKRNGTLIQSGLALVTLFAILMSMTLPIYAQRRGRTYSRANQTRYYRVDTGTTIRVRMEDKVSSKTARIGDRFETSVVDPVYANGVEVIPATSKIFGKVIGVKKAGRKSEAGEVSVSFTSLQLPSGRSYAINGSLAEITENNSSSSTSDNESTVSGGSSKKRNVVFIGGGAATGAAIGAIAGGGKGAGIGAGIGAGLGVAGALLSKGKEAEVNPGTEFAVELNRSISLPSYNR
jgi:hypothetical protein